jgi:hypothetical protein
MNELSNVWQLIHKFQLNFNELTIDLTELVILMDI